MIEHDRAAAEWTDAERAERAEAVHPLGTPVRLRAVTLGVDSVTGTVGRLGREFALLFRPALVGGGARDTSLGRQTLRLAPARPGEPLHDDRPAGWPGRPRARPPRLPLAPQPWVTGVAKPAPRPAMWDLLRCQSEKRSVDSIGRRGQAIGRMWRSPCSDGPSPRVRLCPGTARSDRMPPRFASERIQLRLASSGEDQANPARVKRRPSRELVAGESGRRESATWTTSALAVPFEPCASDAAGANLMSRTGQESPDRWCRCSSAATSICFRCAPSEMWRRSSTYDST